MKPMDCHFMFHINKIPAFKMKVFTMLFHIFVQVINDFGCAVFEYLATEQTKITTVGGDNDKYVACKVLHSCCGKERTSYNLKDK